MCKCWHKNIELRLALLFNAPCPFMLLLHAPSLLTHATIRRDVYTNNTCIDVSNETFRDGGFETRVPIRSTCMLSGWVLYRSLEGLAEHRTYLLADGIASCVFTCPRFDTS